MVEEYKILENDQLQDKAKAKAPIRERKEIRMDHPPRPRRDFFTQVQKPRFEMVSSLYKESVYRIVEKIKHKPYFLWPKKMSGDVLRRNQSLFCSYHRYMGHTTKDCRTFKDYLG